MRIVDIWNSLKVHPITVVIGSVIVYLIFIGAFLSIFLLSQRFLAG